jgi:hypothetical protein
VATIVIQPTIRCLPFRPIINDSEMVAQLERQGVLGSPVATYRIELHDASDSFCGEYQLDFVPGDAADLHFSADFRTGVVTVHHPNIAIAPDGEICLSNGPNGSGICFRASVEPYALPTCDPNAPCPDRSLHALQELSPGAYLSQFDNLRPIASFVLNESEEATRGYAQPGNIPFSLSLGFGVELYANTTPDAPPPPSPTPNHGSLRQTYLLHRTAQERQQRLDSMSFAGERAWFEGIGVPLTYDPISVRMAKRSLVGNPPPEEREFSSLETWKLSRDTLLVPVDVIEAYPTGSAPTLGELGARALFDDPALMDHSFPVAGALVGLVGVAFEDDPFPLKEAFLNASFSPNFRTVAGIVRPDDIFVQCGIQFRLRSYTAIEVSEQAYDKGGASFSPPAPADTPCEFEYIKSINGSDMNRLCFAPWVKEEMAGPAQTLCSADSKVALAEGLLYRSRGTSVAPSAPSGIQVVFAGRISGGYDDDCSPDSTYGLSDASSWAAVSLTLAPNERTALAHEIGHVLLSQGNSAHSTAINSLMISKGSGTHIFGCSNWSRNEIDAPFNCSIVDSSVANGCEKMRSRARVLAGLTTPPTDMEPAPTGSFTWTYGPPSYGNTTPAGFVDRPGGAGKAIQAPNGYSDIASPVFRTADLDRFGTEVQVEVYVPAAVNNPFWVGSVAVSFENIATSTYSYLGIIDLTPLPRGAWSTLAFAVPENVGAVLLGDHPGALFVVTTNTSTDGVLVDNFELAGTLTNRTVPHQSGSSGMDIATTDLWSFEVGADWTSSAALTAEPIDVTHGARALGVEASGWTVITSRAFATSELPVPTSQLGIDVFIPDPQPNPWWVGEVRMLLTCPSAEIHNAFVGNRPLQNLFPNEFNHLVFELPSDVQTALSSSTICSLDIILNTQNGAGRFLLDRLGFE